MSASVTDLTVTNSLICRGTFFLPTSFSGEVPVANQKLRTQQILDVPLTSLRVHDAPQTNLPGTSAADDLALLGATFGTNSMYIGTGDVKTLTVTRYARFQRALPDDYVAGSAITLRAFAGMQTAAADASCTLDVEAYAADGEGGIGSDLCTTAAQSINSTTFANVDFTITPTGLVAGDQLDIRLTVYSEDSAGASAVDPTIGKIQLLTSRQ